MNNTYGTATLRQRWALFCITKKDYRNTVLSKEEAAELIKKLGTKDYKKAKKEEKPIIDELRDYLYANWPEIMKEAMPTMKQESIVETTWNGETERYRFVGFGCGITFLTHRKNNKKAAELKEAANKLHYSVAQNWFLNQFPYKVQLQYENTGCPLGAVWQQDIHMQQTYYSWVLKFAEKKGIKIEMKSYLD